MSRAARWQVRNPEVARGALYRALELLDLTLADRRHQQSQRPPSRDRPGPRGGRGLLRRAEPIPVDGRLAAEVLRRLCPGRAKAPRRLSQTTHPGRITSRPITEPRGPRIHIQHHQLSLGDARRVGPDGGPEAILRARGHTMGNRVGPKGQVVISKPTRDPLGHSARVRGVGAGRRRSSELRFIPPPHERSLKGSLATELRRRPRGPLATAREAAWSLAAREKARRSRP